MLRPLINSLVPAIAILLSMTINTLAQNDFRPGYIITNENDTIFGLLNYRGDIRNSRKCIFKKNETDTLHTFYPFDIRAYRFENSKYYISRMISVNGRENPVFLEYLVNGIAKLYYYREINNSHYYIEKEDGNLYELTNEQKEVTSPDGTKYIAETKKYIGTMKVIFKDCPAIYPEIERAEFNDESFIKIAKDYHDHVCEGDKCIIYEKKLPTIRISAGIFAGYQLTFLHIVDAGREFYSLMDFSAAQSFVPGIQISVVSPRLNEKISFTLDASYLKMHFYADYQEDDFYFDKTYYNEIFMDYSAVKLTAMISYTYTLGKYKPFLSLGLSTYTSTGQSAQTIRETRTENEIITDQFFATPLYNFYWGPKAEAGMTTSIHDLFQLSLGLSYDYVFGDILPNYEDRWSDTFLYLSSLSFNIRLNFSL